MRRRRGGRRRVASWVGLAVPAARLALGVTHPRPRRRRARTRSRSSRRSGRRSRGGRRRPRQPRWWLWPPVAVGLWLAAWLAHGLVQGARASRSSLSPASRPRRPVAAAAPAWSIRAGLVVLAVLDVVLVWGTPACAGDERARHVAAPSPPGIRCRACRTRRSARRHGLARPRRPRASRRRRRRARKPAPPSSTGLAAGLWGLLLFVTSEVAATVPVLAGLAFAGRPMRVAVVSDIHSNLHALEAVSLRSTPTRRTSCGASATSSATGRSRTSAARSIARAGRRLPRGQPRSRGARDDRPRRVHGDAGARGALDARGAREPESQRLLDRLEPQGTAHGVALYHGSARDPVWEYVLSRRSRARDARSDGVAARARRAQPRRAADPHRGDGARAPASPRPGPSSGSATRGRSSIRARSGSRATATRGPPISCSTSTRARASFRRVQYDVAARRRDARRRAAGGLAARLELGQ